MKNILSFSLPTASLNLSLYHWFFISRPHQYAATLLFTDEPMSFAFVDRTNNGPSTALSATHRRVSPPSTPPHLCSDRPKLCEQTAVNPTLPHLH